MQIIQRRRLFSLAMFVTLSLLTAGTLAAQDVRYNFMPGTDFSKYHTYKWVSVEGAGHPNQIVDAQIKQSVDSQLASKGLTKTDGDKADLYVGYQIAVDKEKQWNGYGMGGGVRWGGMASATSSTINVGTLVLDMYDPSKKQLVWTGPLNPARTRKRTRRTWTRPCRSC